MTNTLFRKTLVATLSLGVLATTTSCSSMSDGTKTRTQGTVLGTLGGAGLGALAGLAAGGNTKSVITGLVVGAAAGAIAGFAWGDSVVKQKEAYASMEEYVKDNNTQLGNRISQTKEYNKKLSKQVAQLRKEGKTLSDEDKKEAKQGIDLINKDLATAKDAQKEASGAALDELNSKIAQMESEKKTLSELAAL